MDINKLKKDRSEGLKNLGAVIWMLNSIEAYLVGAISSFFMFDFTDAGKNKSILLNDMLRESKVFSSLENKRILMKKIIERVDKIAIKKKLSFNSQDYILIIDDIKKMQEIRNKLAHNILNFSKDGSSASYINSAREKIDINLNNSLAQLGTVEKNIHTLLDKFLPESNKILYWEEN